MECEYASLLFMIHNTDRYKKIQSWTELKLTNRRKKQIAIRIKQKKKSQIREWVEALLWAVIVVFLINQYVFQLYEIPTPSMENTLLVKDRVFVNKFTYGPEIYPGGPKILSFNQPERNEIIVFENPNYISRGPVFDVVNRIVYMITLSLVNLDKDENGNPRSQLYVKRAIGLPGDTVSFSKGNVFIQPEGYKEKISEKDFRMESGYDFPMKRQILAIDYAAYSSAAYKQAYSSKKIRLPESLSSNNLPGSSNFIDYYHFYKEYYTMQKKIDPSDANIQSLAARYKNGFYIPEKYVLPFGDNRDNSSDGRYFGPIAFQNVLGKTIFKFWPLNRIGIAK
jgi:signal peptidase I